MPRSAPRPDETLEARPFLKWAGGKSQLLSQLETLFPRGLAGRRFLEPFVGGGAVFFRLRRLFRLARVVLSDANGDLIGTYAALRDDPEAVIRRLRRHQALHGREHFYAVRAQSPARLDAAGRAARLIYLNRTCFNGLYRVNRSGRFNVPMGRYDRPEILNEGNLRRVSAALRGVMLRTAHFSQTLREARRGDFIYFDPPYQPLSETSRFTAYTGASFGPADQADLAQVYRELSRRGCKVMLSNSDTPAVRRLYSGFDVRSVSARRSINSDAGRRGPIGEIVVLNYRPAAGTLFD